MKYYSSAPAQDRYAAKQKDGTWNVTEVNV